MSIKNSVPVLVAVAFVFAAGCNHQQVDGGAESGAKCCGTCKTGPTFPEKEYAAAPKIVQKSISALGGLEKWKPIKRIEGEVTLRLYGKWGNPYIDRFAVKMIFTGGLKPKRMGAVSLTDRKLRVDLDSRGRDWAPRYAADPDLQAEVGRSMYLYWLKLVGPWRLLTVAEMKATGQRQIEGEDLERVAVGKGAYYFKPDTSLLRYVTSGTDMPGKEGLVAVYNYELKGPGLVLPKKISIFKIGRHVIVGTEKVIIAELSETKFYKTEL